MLERLIKNSFKIYKADLSKICKNWVSLIVIGGLVLLPSLYAWINIYASWDPYGNTKEVKVGIINEDKGGTIKDSKVNIGEEVISSLKENESLGWEFFDSREEGLKELEQGEIYATIIIPNDFSEKILTLLDKQSVKPELEYYVNEKINAIAPKITDKGATTIQSQITASFVETVADKLIEVMRSVGIEIDKEYPSIEKLGNMMISIQNRFPDLESGLDYLIQKVDDGKVIIDRQDENVVYLQSILGQLMTFNGNLAEALEELSTKPEEIIPEIKENLVLVQTIFADISSSIAELKDAIELNKPEMIQDIDELIVKLENTKQHLDDFSGKTAELDGSITSTVNSITDEMQQALERYILLLEDAKGKLDSPEEALEVLTQLESVNNKLVDEIRILRTAIEGASEKVEVTFAKVQAVLEKIEALIPVKSVEPTLESEEKEPKEDMTNEENLFINEIGEILELVETVKSDMSENKLYADALYTLNNIQTQLISLKNIAQDAESSQEQVNALKVQGRSLSSMMQDIRTHIELREDGVLDKLSSIEDVLSEANRNINRLKNIVTEVITGGQKKIEDIISKLEQVEEKLTSAAQKLLDTTHNQSEKVQEKVDQVKENINKLQEQLQNLSVTIQDRTVVEDTLGNISQFTYSVQASLNTTIDLMDSDLIMKLKEQISRISNFVTDVRGFIGNIQNELEYLRDFGERLQSKGELLVEDINKIKEHLPFLKENINKLADKINLLNETVDVKDLIEQLTSDNSEKSDFLASPVELNTHKLYPMANYGAAMTPFYTTLCLWVGALLLCALLSTKAKNVEFKYTPVQEYFGKYMLFATLAMMQGFIAAMGDIFVLEVEVKHQVLFVSLTVMYSLVFSAIVYTLVSLFGNVGKAIGVIFMVLQLAGSGGTFPIQVTPEFFQNIHQFLPFTYGISGMREAIAGVYYETLTKDVIMLGVFFVLFIFSGVLLKKKANAFLYRFSKKLGESGVIEH